MTRARAGLLLTIGVVLAALLLRYGVPVAAELAEGHGPIAGELIFGAAVFGAMLVLAAALGRTAGLKAIAPGTAPATAALRGSAIGGAGLLLAVGYCALAGTLSGGNAEAISWALAVGAVAVAVQVLAEEALFRGVLQPLAIDAVGRVTGIGIVAVTFAILHALAGEAEPLDLVNMALGGLLFGCLALRDRGIAGAVAAHLAWNGGEQLVLGLDPNPGVGSFGALIDLDLAGSPLWGGSGSGLNSSLAMTLALLAVLAVAAMRLRAGTTSAAPSRTVLA